MAPDRHSMTEMHRSTDDATGAFITAGYSPVADGIGGVAWGTSGGGGAGGVFYVPTGFTDTEVQAAADAAEAAGGGVVYCPAGTYPIATTITLHQTVSLWGDGREATIFEADDDSINLVQVTGTTQRSTLEVDFASRVRDIGFFANGHTGCNGVAFIGVAYFAVERCTFDGFVIGLDYFGSLQGVTYDCKFLSNATAISYTAEAIGYYVALPTLPPSRVLVSWCTFYYNTEHCIDWSGGQQIIIENSEMGDNGTAADASTSAIKIAGAGDTHGFGLIGRNLWLENNHGLAVVEIAGTSVNEHSLTDCWFVYSDSTYSITVDGSTASQTLSLERIHHDKVVSPATVDTIRSQGGTTILDARWSNGSLSGTWTTVSQTPLLSEQLVSDLSQFLALRLPNLTTTARDAIASPTAGMVIWNTTTTAVNQYTGSAWQALGASSTHYEVLMTGASPAEPLEDGSGTDWLYIEVPN